MNKIIPVMVFVFIITVGNAIFPDFVSAKQTIPSQDKLTELTQIDILKVQNQLLKEHNVQLLSVVQWSLGFAALFLIVYLTVNWFILSRRLEQDKQYLQLHLSNIVRDLINIEMDKLSQKMQTDFSKQVDQINDWKTEYESVLNAKTVKLTNSVTKSVSDFVLRFDEKLDSLNHDILNMKLELAKDESYTKFKAYVNLIEFECNHRIEYYGYFIGNNLDGLLTLLNGYIPDADDVAALTKALGKVPKDYQATVEKLEKKIRHQE